MKAHVLAYKKHLMREALAAATLAEMHAAK